MDAKGQELTCPQLGIHHQTINIRADDENVGVFHNRWDLLDTFSARDKTQGHRVRESFYSFWLQEAWTFTFLS